MENNAAVIAALEQAMQALDAAMVEATMKKREAPEAPPVEEAAPPVPTEEE